MKHTLDSLIVFLWDISCLQLHSHIPFPASVCSMNSGQTLLWVLGTQGDNGSPLSCSNEKDTLPLGSSPDFNTDFTRLCFFTLAESMAGDKGTTLLFFLFPEDFFFASLKYKPVRESDL